MSSEKSRFTIVDDQSENIQTIQLPKKNSFLKYIKLLTFFSLFAVSFYFFWKNSLFSKIDAWITNFLVEEKEQSSFKKLKTTQDLLDEFYLPEGSKNINLAKCLNLYQKKFYKQAILYCKEFSNNSLKPKDKSIALTVLGILSDKNNRYQEAKDYLKQSLELDKENIYALYNLTLVYKHIGDFANARLSITNAKTLSPNNSKVSLLAGNLLNELNEPQNAIKSYKDGLEKEPENSFLIYNMALTKFKQGNISDAILDFKKAASLGNGKVALDSYLYLGSIYFDKKDFAKSEQFFRQAVNLVPDSPKYLYNLAKVLFLQGKKEDSLAYLKKSLIANFDDPIVYQSISSLFLDLDNYNLAIESLEKGLKIKPNQVDLLFSVAGLYKEKGDYLSAESSYQKIIESTPGNSFTEQALLDLSNLYQEIDRLQKSEEMLKKLLSISLKNDKAYFSLGNIYKKQQKFDLALENWKKAVQINPNNLEAAESIGDYFYKNLVYDRAEKEYTSILKRDNNKFNIYLKLANVYLKQGRLVESQAIFQKVAQSSENKSYKSLSYQGLAKSYIMMGGVSNLEKAKQNSYLSLKIDNQNQESRLFLAKVLIKVGLASDIENAIDELKVLIQSNVETSILSQAYNYLGFCYHKQGNEQTAIEYYQKALEIDPNYMEAYQNKKLSLSNIQKQSNDKLF